MEHARIGVIVNKRRLQSNVGDAQPPGRLPADSEIRGILAGTP